MPQNTETILIIAALALLAIIILVILIKKIRNNALKNDVNDLNIQFNEIKSIPLAFKLNKATYIAKINEETQIQVEQYRDKFDICQRHIEQVQCLLDEIEDNIAIRKTKQAKESIRVIKESIEDAYNEAKEIESFLDTITQREHTQREYSNELKDKYRDLKQKALDNINELSFAYEGVEDRLKFCEDLFSTFEEQIYANDFVKAQECLEIVAKNLDDINITIDEIPSLVHMSKGQIPTIIDEVTRQYEITRQRGVYLAHVSIDDRLKGVNTELTTVLKHISNARCNGAKESLAKISDELTSIMNVLKGENEAQEFVKKSSDEAIKLIGEIEKVYNYIGVVYSKDKEKFDLNDLTQMLNSKDTILSMYKKAYTDLMAAVSANVTASTKLKERALKLLNEAKSTYDDLYTYKTRIDNAANDENRAITQVVKLQIVLNEVEVKIAQYRLPAISDSYKQDLKLAHDSINDIKVLLDAIPLDIPTLNTKLDETIDFVYKLYNNVNNIVGMALMVENAIVFGNKYRSSYPEVDAELSKAEFAYLNGEYTQALTIAIACIEKLFPKTGDQKILEYAKA